MIEELFLKSLIDSCERANKEMVLEEQIRDSIIFDLENTNTSTKNLLGEKTFFLSFEKWINVSESEKSRADIVFSTTGFEFVLECKLLKFADKKYIEEGLKRFVELKYAEKDTFAGMIGFIIKGNPDKILQKLKKKVKSYHLVPDSEYLLNKLVLEHPLSFQSRHLRLNDTPIHLYHLLFDFTSPS